MMRRTLGLKLYGALTALATPLAPYLLDKRLKAGKEDPERIGERLGQASRPRPDGPLVWLHGASVGESLSLLPVIERLTQARPDIVILVTSGTLTSAKVLQARLPTGAIHQYVPVDTPGAARRFLDHWRPGLAVFVESELWPNLLMGASDRGSRMALLGARISEASARGWARAPRAARALLSAFDMILAQDGATRQRLERMGALVSGEVDLKHAAGLLPCSDAALAELKAMIGQRPVIVAASTHTGEDELVAAAFVQSSRVARPTRATLKPLLVLIPRHPDRGPAIVESLSGQRLTIFRRSAGDMPHDACDIYIADTLGELGLFFRLARLVVMGGGFLPGIGGHNPLEPARLGVAVVSGPHVANFQRTYDLMGEARAVSLAEDGAALAERMADMLAHPDRAREMGLRAKAYCERGDAALEAAWAGLEPLLPR